VKDKHYDVIIVGAGIAGLAISELLARSGQRVMLVEKSNYICGGSSADMAGWLHTGALYAQIPDPTFYRIMAGNIDDLLTYYGSFPAMNIRREGAALVASNTDGWFRNTLNQYAYAHWRSPEVPLMMKLPWAISTKLAKARIEGFEQADQTTSFSSQVSWLLRSSNVSEGRQLPYDLGMVTKPLVTKDRTMRPTVIIEDLLRSFIYNGGVLKTGFDWDAPHVGFTYSKVIKTMGRNNPQAMANFISPILVAYPPLSTMNFIKMTPDIRKTLNHMYHEIEDGVGYSVIGSGDFLPVGACEDDKAAMVGTLFHRVDEAFGYSGDRQMRVYWGYKTEMCKTGQLRNYQYHILETTNPDVIEVLPGKFTLAFSLAVNVCKYLGIAPVTGNPALTRLKANVSQHVAPSRHAAIAREMHAPFQPL
jgi:hypothetical protein